MSRLDLVILGPLGNTHIASCFDRAARKLGLRCEAIDVGPAYSGNRIARSLLWRFGGRRPIRLNQFSSHIFGRLEVQRPQVLITVGQSALNARTLRSLRSLGVRCLNFSTDDPFNPAHRGSWQLDGLREYDAVYTPRLANIDDLRRLPCREVRYLPFGYDEELMASTFDVMDNCGCETVFVGGADADREQFFQRFIRAGGGRPIVVGGYWERCTSLDADRRGPLLYESVVRLTTQAAVNLCLVRRSNRDGHVMRSFEIPAIGGFMIAEATTEHRAFFGEEGRATLYFNSPEEAAEKTRWALAHPDERRRMAELARELVRQGNHTYKDRLLTMLHGVLPLV